MTASPVPALVPAPARDAALELAPDDFRAMGHRLVDDLADFLAGVRDRRVTTGLEPRDVRAMLPAGALPDAGVDAAALLREATDLVTSHSLLNGHPRFFGYITASAAPLGALADLLAAAVNPNAGARVLSPVATEIETQAVRWIAELLGMPAGSGGLLVSGGNMANIAGLAAARRAKVPWDVRALGMRGPSDAPTVTIHASRETHTWVQKAADLLGFGTDAIRWVECDTDGRLRLDALERSLGEDRARGALPAIVVATAGTVSTGAVDPIPAIAALCRRTDAWLHVDGAYGAPAAIMDDAGDDLRGLALADSLAMDPHKWLYAPLEAGCTLVRDPRHLIDAFSFHPTYYEFGGAADDPPINYYELGPQNSRGFRALKVWLGLRQAGRAGLARMIADDCHLARALYDAAAAHPELEARTLGLSIATFRYVPRALRADAAAHGEYLDALNRAILERVQREGEAFVSNALVGGAYVLRACIVNFRTTREDVLAVPGIVARVGREVDAGMRPPAS